MRLVVLKDQYAENSRNCNQANGREFLFYAEYNGTCKFLKRGEDQSEFLIQEGWRQGGQEESPTESRLETGHPPRPAIQVATS